MTRRSGFSFYELTAVVALVSLFMVGLLGPATTISAQRQQLAEQLDDLERCVVVADRTGRAIRTARAVLPAAPDGVVVTGSAALVLDTDEGPLAIHLVPGIGGPRVALRRYRPDGAFDRVEDWGPVGGLAFRLEPAAGSARLVAFDVVLPPRARGAGPAALSSRACPGGGRR